MNSAANRLACHVCAGPIHFGHRAHRGLLSNAINYLQSTLITTREQLATFRKKKWSKQFAEQHKKDIETMKVLEARVAEDEKTLAELKRIKEECYE